MEELIALRPTLVAKRDALSALITHIDTITGVPAVALLPASPLTTEPQPAPGRKALRKAKRWPAGEPAPAPEPAPAKRIGRASKPEPVPAPSRRKPDSAHVAAMREIVNEFTQGFTVKQAHEALLQKLGPKYRLPEGFVAGTCFRWAQMGLLRRAAGGGGPGKPSTYERTKNWAATSEEASDKEKEYKRLRMAMGINPPLSAEELP